MRIFVHAFTGKIFALECESIDTIAHIKEKLNVVVGLPLHQQRLIVSGTRVDEFSENKTLADIGIQEKSSFSLLSRLPGGGGGEIERPRAPEKGYLHYADAFKYGWREEYGKVFLDLLLKFFRDGDIKEGNMTDEAWLSIQTGLNNSAKCSFEVDFLQERLRDYKQLYSLLAEASSPIFHWDRENKTIRIKSNWRECHPQLLLLCGEYIPYFDTLEELCLLLNSRQSPEQQVAETSKKFENGKLISQKTQLSKKRSRQSPEQQVAETSNNIENGKLISQKTQLSKERNRFRKKKINMFRKFGEKFKQLLPWMTI